MLKFRHLLKIISILLVKINKKIFNIISNQKLKLVYVLLDKRAKKYVPIINRNMVFINDLEFNRIDPKSILYLNEMYINHRYDLLGSGWVKNFYNSIALGIENIKYNMNLSIGEFDKEGNWLRKILPISYIRKSKKYWGKIINTYNPIDWQKDYKSGYRWDSKKSYLSQKIAPKIGADIKVPWELSRLQHLPQLAIFSLLPQVKKKRIY